MSKFVPERIRATNSIARSLAGSFTHSLTRALELQLILTIVPSTINSRTLKLMKLSNARLFYAYNYLSTCTTMNASHCWSADRFLATSAGRLSPYRDPGVNDRHHLHMTILAVVSRPGLQASTTTLRLQ